MSPHVSVHLLDTVLHSRVVLKFAFGGRPPVDKPKRTFRFRPTLRPNSAVCSAHAGRSGEAAQFPPADIDIRGGYSRFWVAICPWHPGFPPTAIPIPRRTFKRGHGSERDGRDVPQPEIQTSRKPCGVRSARPMRFRTAPTVMSLIGWSRFRPGKISAVGAIRLHAALCADTQSRYRGLGQRHPMWFARFHPCRWHRPYTAFKIDLIPPNATSFAALSPS